MDPLATSGGLSLVACSLCGLVLGTVSGLVPGLHANNFALVLVAVAPEVPAPTTAVACVVLAAGVAHTFLDVVPALALGVPDAAMAVGALPGHRLVLGGRGREALRLSALGSGVALAVSVPLAIPLTAAVVVGWEALRAAVPAVLAVVFAALVATERSPTAAVAAAALVGLSGLLGLVALDLDPDGVLGSGGVLTPLFAGLFGAPVLVDALGGEGVPQQGDTTLAASPWQLARSAVAGVGGGGLVGYVPGVSAGVAATLALPVAGGGKRADTDRAYVVATSGANTATAVFALFSLVALDAPRTGVTVALREVGTPPLPTLLAAAALSGAVAVVLVPVLGDRYLRLVGRVRPAVTSGLGCLLLVGLSALFAGGVGVVVFVVAALVGLLPPRLGVRRVHLMGVLAVPLTLG